MQVSLKTLILIISVVIVVVVVGLSLSKIKSSPTIQLGENTRYADAMEACIADLGSKSSDEDFFYCDKQIQIYWDEKKITSIEYNDYYCEFAKKLKSRCETVFARNYWSDKECNMMKPMLDHVLKVSGVQDIDDFKKFSSLKNDYYKAKCVMPNKISTFAHNYVQEKIESADKYLNDKYLRHCDCHDELSAVKSRFGKEHCALMEQTISDFRKNKFNDEESVYRNVRERVYMTLMLYEENRSLYPKEYQTTKYRDDFNNICRDLDNYFAQKEKK